MPEPKLIVGLGNPGSEYEQTRHNLGFLTVQKLCEKLDFKLGLSSFTNGLTAEGVIQEQTVIFLMPLTYMNKSGIAVKQTKQRFDISCEDILVVCDDLKLSFGQLRLRPDGSHGGNNGLKSIIHHVKEKAFPRLRMGIGSPLHRDQDVDYVLSDFSEQEKKELDFYMETAGQCCLSWATNDIHQVMDQFNRKMKEEG